MTVIHGRVNADGTRESGSEFDVVKLDTGRYFVSFPRGTFDRTPQLVVSHQPVGEDDPVVMAAYEDRFFCETLGEGGHRDRPFCFVAREE